MKLIVLFVLGVVLVAGCIGGSTDETFTITPQFTTLPVVASTVGNPMKLTVVNDKDCKSCDTTQIIEYSKTQLFSNLEVEEIDISTERGAKLVADLQINVIPAYIFNNNVEQSDNFEKIKEAFIKIGDDYLIHPASIGAGKYLNPPGADDDPVKGDEDAPITIVEFSDFECPFCGQFFKQTLPQLQEEYIDTGKVRLVYRDFPLEDHENAIKAAEAAQCAHEQGKFWEYHDTLFVYQAALEVESLKKYAVDIGLDSEKFNECLDSDKYASEVLADLQDGTNLGYVSATPSFFIGDVILVGAQPFENFKTVIDAKLAELGE